MQSLYRYIQALFFMSSAILALLMVGVTVLYSYLTISRQLVQPPVANPSTLAADVVTTVPPLVPPLQTDLTGWHYLADERLQSSVVTKRLEALGAQPVSQPEAAQIRLGESLMTYNRQSDRFDVHISFVGHQRYLASNDPEFALEVERLVREILAVKLAQAQFALDRQLRAGVQTARVGKMVALLQINGVAGQAWLVKQRAKPFDQTDMEVAALRHYLANRACQRAWFRLNQAERRTVAEVVQRRHLAIFSHEGDESSAAERVKVVGWPDNMPALIEERLHGDFAEVDYMSAFTIFGKPIWRATEAAFTKELKRRGLQ